MLTMSDYADDVVVQMELTVGRTHVLDLVMQPDLKTGKLGVVIVNWEDFSVDDARDLLRAAQETLTRYLNKDPVVDVRDVTSEWLDEQGPDETPNWPF